MHGIEFLEPAARPCEEVKWLLENSRCSWEKSWLVIPHSPKFSLGENFCLQLQGLVHINMTRMLEPYERLYIFQTRILICQKTIPMPLLCNIRSATYSPTFIGNKWSDHMVRPHVSIYFKFKWFVILSDKHWLCECENWSWPAHFQERDKELSVSYSIFCFLDNLLFCLLLVLF